MANRHVDTGITQRGKSYTFVVAMGRDVNGKQIRKTTTFTPPEGLTQKKADKLAKEEYVDFKNKCKGLQNYNENIRFSELVEAYLKIYAPNKLKPITAYNYERLIRYHLIPYFGQKKLKDINRGVLTEFFCNLKKINEDGTTTEYSYGNIKKVYTIMQSLFHFAVSQDFIKETPCKNVVLPEKDKHYAKKKRYLTEEELPRFLGYFEGYSMLNTIVKLLLFTGMRCGEALGLRWEDIDFNKKEIHIVNNMTDLGGKHFLTSPKTESSIRVICFGEQVKSLLEYHREKQHELQERLGSDFAHPEMVFTSDLGNYKDRSTLNTSLKRHLKNTEFTYITLHCLRHSNATFLLNSGVDLKIVSEHLGHSEIGVTADVYADVLKSSQKRTAQILDEKISALL